MDKRVDRMYLSQHVSETHWIAALTDDIKLLLSSIEVIKSATIAGRLNYCRVLSAARRK